MTDKPKFNQKFIVITLLLLLLLDLFLFGMNIFNKHTIYLKNGDIIYPESTESADEYIVYTIQGRTYFLDYEDMYFHHVSSLLNPEDLQYISSYYLAELFSRVVKFTLVAIIIGALIYFLKGYIAANKPSISKKNDTDHQKTSREQEKGPGVIKEIISFFIEQSDALLKLIQETLKIKSPSVHVDEIIQEKHYLYGSTNSIVNFFLELFRTQLNADPSCPAEFIICDHESNELRLIFELRIETEGKIKTRRMSIRKLGKESSSKSSCFYVMYDHPIVVKFPQPHIKDFQEYLTIIKREKQFSETLHPVTSIVPSVSIILEKFLPPTQNCDPEPESKENYYLDLMESDETLNTKLIIDGSYVIFMDLSDHYLMGQVLRKFADFKSTMKNEVLGNPVFISRPYEFEAKYGIMKPELLERVHEIFTHFEDYMIRLSSKYPSISLSTHKCHQMFLSYLLDIDPDPDKNLSEQEFYVKGEHYFSSLTNPDSEAVKSCASTIISYYSKINFKHHKQKFTSIIENLMVLLTQIHNKGFIMRDLKPDNVLVVGDSSKFPLFLNSKNEFSLGLIDLETATHLKQGKVMEQPKLSGTPLYALPHQFIQNSMLSTIYEQLNRGIYLQDWYAACVMIYEIVSGAKLFTATVPVVSRCIKEVNRQHKESHQDKNIIKKNFGHFWFIAMAEFNKNMKKNGSKLQHLNVSLPDAVIEMLTKELDYTITEDQTSRNKFLETCRTRYPDIDKLVNKKSHALRGFIDMYKAKNRTSEKVTELEMLCYYNFRLEKLVQFKNLLAKNNISVHELLVILFYCVYTGLHKAEWGTPKYSK